MSQSDYLLKRQDDKANNNYRLLRLPAAARTLKTRKLNDMTRMALTPKEPSRLLCSTYVELHNARACQISSKKYKHFSGKLQSCKVWFDTQRYCSEHPHKSVIFLHIVLSFFICHLLNFHFRRWQNLRSEEVKFGTIESNVTDFYGKKALCIYFRQK